MRSHCKKLSHYLCMQETRIKKLINMCLCEINDAVFIYDISEEVSLSRDNREDIRQCTERKAISYLHEFAEV